MDTMKTVGIKELKDSLSAYIREIKRGSRILVTDRNQVVAELREPTVAALPAASEENVLLEQWVREGKIRLPVRPKKPLPRSGLRFPAGTALKLLDEDRRE